MTFREKYRTAKSWAEKATIMELYQLAMTANSKELTTKSIADYFGVSVGLVSENLRLAHALHVDQSLAQVPLRQDALKRIR